MGDGVNIAARLEGIAEPGGICLSEDAHRQGVIGSRTSSSTSGRERERERPQEHRAASARMCGQDGLGSTSGLRTGLRARQGGSA
jgi:class 3 adenylate cyclase